MELRGRTALLTGAAGGLGAHIARGLAAEGVTLALSDLPGAALDERVSELRGRGARAEGVPADLLDREQRDGLVAAAEEAVGPIDILVNNAGLETTAPVVEFRDEELERIMEVNLVAPFVLIRSVVPGMLRRGRGHVVSLASLAGKIVPAYMAPYGMTKAGVLAMTQALRAEHANDPVGFSAVCPNFVRGEGMISSLEEADTKIPRGVGTSPPSRVPRAVVRCIERDLPEVVIAHRRPMRVLLALNALAPRFTERLTGAMGAQDVFRATAEHRGRLGERS
jgi:short-subunit dehydrogenase